MSEVVFFPGIRHAGTKPLEPVANAVMVQLVDGKPLLSLMVKDEDARPELEQLARKIFSALDL